MFRKIDHYYKNRWRRAEFGRIHPRKDSIVRIVWKYTWLDNSKYYYKIEMNSGDIRLIEFSTNIAGKRSKELFFTRYQRISKLKCMLLW